MYTLAPFKSSTYLMKAQTKLSEKRRMIKSEMEKPHSRDLPPYIAMATSDQGYIPCLIGNLLRRPGWLGRNKLAEDPNPPRTHGSDFGKWWRGWGGNGVEGR
jgi:hypothetical protein